MRHLLKTVSTLIMGLALATPAIAANSGSQSKSALLSYKYVQLSYVDFDSDFSGFKIDGAFDIQSDLALIASYLSADRRNAYDYDLFTLGLAYHQRLSGIPKSDIVLHGEFEHASVNYWRNNDDNGVRLGAMLRGQIQRNIELFGDVSYTSLYDNDLGLTLGLNLALNQQFSIVASGEFSDDDMFLLGVRLQLK